jgi:hypothetical protein
MPVARAIPIVMALLLCAGLVPAAARPAGLADTAVPPYPKLARGDFVFFPMQVHTDPLAKDAYFDYLKRFRVCLTNGYEVFTGDDLAQVKDAGCELFVYRWFEGYYVNEVVFGHPAVRSMLQEVDSHPDWLINPHTPTAGNGATLPAYFFDWANPDLRAFYIDRLVAALDANGYDGVFFDYIGDWGLPAQISKLWALKHPEATYNEASAVFLAELRRAMGDRPVFGNAAYKADKAEANAAFYESVTYDTTESYGVSYASGKDAVVYLEGKGMTAVKETYYRPWDGPAGYKDYMEGGVFGPVPHQDGVVEFFPIDYVQPAYEPTGDEALVNGVPVPVYRAVPDRAAVHYSYALAKLHDMASFASDWGSWQGDPTAFDPDELYFADLGRPLEATYREGADAVVRYFENGFVVVTRTNPHNNSVSPTPVPTGSAAPVHFAPDPAMVPADATGLWDLYSESAVTGSGAAVEITPVLYPATGSYYPSGRVYMYTRP